MNTIEARVNSFIKDNLLDQGIKDSINDLVSGCILDLFQQLYTVPIPTKEPKKEKVLKEDKIDDPTTVKSREELRLCTTTTLNTYCKENDLKIGGNKTEVMDRVWRCLQNNLSENDRSLKSKPKKEKQIPEKYACAGKNAKGAPCSNAGTELCGEVHLCWRHAKASVSSDEEKKETEPKLEKTKSKRVEKMIKKFEYNSDELVTDDEDYEIFN